MVIRNLTRGTSLGDSIDVAESSSQRTVGLLKHTELRPGHGLWITPCEGVHTFFMKFGLDLVYVDRKKIVRKAVANVPPWRVSFCLRAHSIVELPVGTISQSGTVKGDQLEFVR